MVWIRSFADLSFSILIVLSACLAGVYWLLWYDKGTSISSQISSLNNQKSNLSKELRELKNKLKNLQEIDATVNEMGKEFDKFLQFIPNELTSLKILKHLNDSARNSGVDLQNMGDHQVRQAQKGEFYERVRINVLVKGFFSQILSFLSKLTGLSEIITVDSFTITQRNSRRSSGTLDEVEIRMDIYGYRYVSELAQN